MSLSMMSSRLAKMTLIKPFSAARRYGIEISRREKSLTSSLYRYLTSSCRLKDCSLALLDHVILGVDL